MPHIHLETTADLVENGQIPDILEHLAQTLSSLESIEPQAVKAYHTLRSNWCTGENGPAGFAHCTVMVMTGRPPELRKLIADAMYASMVESFRESLDEGQTGLTLELREMDRDTYRKTAP